MDRIVSLQDHLKRNPLTKCPNDVVICAAVRTPLTRAKKGNKKKKIKQIKDKKKKIKNKMT
jgi:hypothetical protein